MAKVQEPSFWESMSPEAWVTLLTAVFQGLQWAVELGQKIIENHNSPDPVSPEQWAEWETAILSAHSDVQRED